MTRYSSLASFYDSVMPGEDYELWAECCDGIFSASGVRTVIDLACGTGTLSWALAQRGYEVIAVDASCEMLSEAQAKAPLFQVQTAPIFINQTLEELDLYGTADAAICSMDGINYLSPAALKKALHRLGFFLEKGGLFFFDVNTPQKFQRIDGCAFIDESEDAYCAWSADYDPDRGRCLFEMDIFLREGRLWRREAEEHEEFAYSVERLEKMLAEAGFADIEVFGGLPLRAAREDEDRLFIMCRSGK